MTADLIQTVGEFIDGLVMDNCEFVCGSHGILFNKKKRFAKHVTAGISTCLDLEGIMKIQFGGKNGEYIVIMDKDKNTVVTMESPHCVQWRDNNDDG